MRFLAACLLLLSTRVAQAAPSDEARTCVAASTEGQIARDEGKLIAAHEQLSVCARESCPTVVRESCQRWLSEVLQRTPSIVLRIYGRGGTERADLKTTLDGVAVALSGQAVPVDPGLHRVRVEAKEGVIERAFSIEEKTYGKLIAIDLPVSSPSPDTPVTPAPSPPARAFRVPFGAWLLSGVGLAGVATFAVLRTRAAHELSTLERSCAPSCSDGQRDHGKRIARAADGSLGVGLAALGGAGLWALGGWLARARHADRHSALMLSPERAGATLTWAGSY